MPRLPSPPSPAIAAGRSNPYCLQRSGSLLSRQGWCCGVAQSSEASRRPWRAENPSEIPRDKAGTHLPARRHRVDGCGQPPSFARLQQAHLLPWRRETAAIEPVVLIAAVEAQPLAGQPEALGKQVGELAFAAHAAAEAAVVILAATGLAHQAHHMGGSLRKVLG